MIYFLLFFLFLMVLYTYKIFRFQSVWENIPSTEWNPSLHPQTKISVIIAARNEEQHLQPLLNSLVAQNYPSHLWELIIIDDHSTDATATIIAEYAQAHPHIRLISLSDYTHLYPPTQAFKKLAITVGVKQSVNELIVCTDADCILPPNWLSIYDQAYQQNHWHWIAAPVRLKTGGSLVDIFQSLDFITLQGITGAAVHQKMFSMCNGANLAFTKEAFETVNGYEGISHIPSGDDLLLMHKIVSAYPNAYGYIKSEAVVVDTNAPKTWSELLNQRIRWASKTGHYKDKKITNTLVLVFLINLCFVILGISAFFAVKWFTFFCLLLFAKFLIEYPFVEAVAKFFGGQRYLKYFPLMQIPHIFYTVSAGIMGKLKKYQWKERVIQTK